MKNLFRLSFIAVLFFSLASFITTDLVQNWNVDKAHSWVGFSVNHFFTPVNGWFDDYVGSFLFDPDRLAESKADFTIKVASVRTRIPNETIIYSPRISSILKNTLTFILFQQVSKRKKVRTMLRMEPNFSRYHQ